MKQSQVVVIGGGTGSFALLQDLKMLTPHITALVNMVDDGGSTGVLRDELGVLPPGDIRQCLVALSEAPEELRELFNFRFASGTLSGHSFGNLFLSAVEKMTDDFTEAVRIAGDVLRIRGRVLPVTVDNHRLEIRLADGQKLVGQQRISTMPLIERPQLTLDPSPSANPDAVAAIINADVVVIAPGNLYGSLVPTLLVDGIAKALRQTAAKIVFVCNLVNRQQTPNFTVADYVSELERFAGSGTIDYVLYNTDLPDDDILERYALEGDFPVIVDTAQLAAAHYQAIPGAFLSRKNHSHRHGDTLIKRSLIRHDGAAVTATLQQLIP